MDLYFPSPSTPQWRGAQLKKAQRQIYLYFYPLLRHPQCYSPIVREMFTPTQNNMKACTAVMFFSTWY